MLDRMRAPNSRKCQGFQTRDANTPLDIVGQPICGRMLTAPSRRRLQGAVCLLETARWPVMHSLPTSDGSYVERRKRMIPKSATVHLLKKRCLLRKQYLQFLYVLQFHRA